jgi:UTP:GlnB (protein PII) uridylyltransferase
LRSFRFATSPLPIANPGNHGDRIGLLHDVLDAISAGDVDIAHAIIVTEEGEAADVFFLTGTDGKKILDKKRLMQIEEAVLAAVD